MNFRTNGVREINREREKKDRGREITEGRERERQKGEEKSRRQLRTRNGLRQTLQLVRLSFYFKAEKTFYITINLSK